MLLFTRLSALSLRNAVLTQQTSSTFVRTLMHNTSQRLLPFTSTASISSRFYAYRRDSGDSDFYDQRRSSTNRREKGDDDFYDQNQNRPSYRRDNSGEKSYSFRDNSERRSPIRRGPAFKQSNRIDPPAHREISNFVKKLFENIEGSEPSASTFDSVPQESAPKATTNFESLNVDPNLLSILKEKGFKDPTPIQALVIPPALEGRDIIALSHTGSGKTAAFAIPIVQKLLNTKGGHKFDARRTPLEALVLVPTRELAVQIRQVFEMLRVHAAIAVGGQSASAQLKDIDHSRVLIATPGRLLDFIQSSYVDLRHVRYLVIDEVDRMLDMGFLDSVQTICKAVPSHRQTLLFSATLPPSAAQLARQFLIDPFEVGKGEDISQVGACDIQHLVLRCRPDEKFDNLTDVLKFIVDKQRDPRVLIFANTKLQVNRLTELLNDVGFPSIPLHGDLPFHARQHSLGQFRNGRINVLIATNVAARGLDVKNITHVINFDMAQTTDDYVHRTGRTGRAGMSGVALSFISMYNDVDLRLQKELQKGLHLKLDDFDYAKLLLRPTQKS